MILLSIFGSIVYSIYQKPESLFNKETQTQLLEVADQIDKSLDEDFKDIPTSTGSTSTGSTSTGTTSNKE